MYLSTGNKKLKSTKETRFLVFNLPAKQTCPFATEMCKADCYAVKAERQYKNVLPCRTENLKESKQADFVDKMSVCISSFLSRPAYRKANNIFFRIHESGDFYSQKYFDKWVQIARHFPSVTFLAYTKSVRYVCNTVYTIPANMIIRFSLWADTKEEEKAIACGLCLPTYTAEHLTEENKTALGDRFCDCKDCGACGKCYNTTVKDIVCEIH